MPTTMEKITTITIPDAFVMSLLGFAIVFAILVILMFVISFLRSAVAKMEAAPAAPVPASAGPALAAAAPAPAADPNMVPAKGSLGDVKLHSVDDKTAALLMAIVADELKAPLNELRFTSIREKK